MNQIFQQMLKVTSARGFNSDRIQVSDERIIISGESESSLVAERINARIKVLISHGPDEPTGFLSLFDSEIEKMNTEEESICLDAFDYGLELLTPKGAIQSERDNG